MTTTSSTMTAGKATTGHGGHGSKHGRFQLRALVVSMVTLGCAVALAFAVLFGGAAARSRSHAAIPLAQPAAGSLDWEQAERAQVAPLLAVAVLDWEQQDRTQVAPSQPSLVLDWEQAERQQVAPQQVVPLLDWEQVERSQVAP